MMMTDIIERMKKAGMVETAKVIEDMIKSGRDVTKINSLFEEHFNEFDYLKSPESEVE